MRLKLDTRFQPCPVDDADELFANGIFVFNVTKLLSRITANPDRFPVEQVTVDTLGLTFSVLDQDTVQTADLSKPIVLAEIAPRRFNVIDGNHRIGRARGDEVSTLPAYRLACRDHIRFLTSEEGYRSYVEYWNRKVADLAAHELCVARAKRG